MSDSAEFNLLEALVLEIRATDSKHTQRFEHISEQLERLMGLVVESNRERERREKAFQDQSNRHAQRIAQLESVAASLTERLAATATG